MKQYGNIIINGLVLLTLAFAVINLTFAADTLNLTLDDCFRLALRDSPAMQKTRLDSLASAGDWLSVRAKRFPQFKLSGETPSLNEAVDYSIVYNPDNERNEFSRVSSGDQRWQSRIEIDKTLPWGATFNISTGLYKSTWYNDRIGSGEDTTEYSFRRRFSLSQPLLAGNPVGREYKIGKIAWQNSLINYELEHRQIRYRTRQLFFNLVSASSALDISSRDLEQGKSAGELASRKLQAGLIPEVELLQIQVDLARREGNYRQSEGRVEAAADRLKNELGLPLDLYINTHWSAPVVYQDFPDTFNTSGERLELTSEKLNLERIKLDNRAAVLYERIRASLELYYDMETRHNELDLLDKPNDRNYGAVLHFDLPLFGFGFTRGRIEKYRANLARAQINYSIREAEFVIELREVIRTVKRTAERITIAEAALKLSEKSYDITTERFANGVINSRQLLDSQLDLTQTRTDLLNARIDYEMALANLERIAPK
ncbi:MAG: TolC family protein [Candidatus Hatepunaea meridiana]|nr:TolC family protein [Candidatus Hatepunaea meridiana]